MSFWIRPVLTWSGVRQSPSCRPRYSCPPLYTAPWTSSPLTCLHQPRGSRSIPPTFTAHPLSMCSMVRDCFDYKLLIFRNYSGKFTPYLLHQFLAKQSQCIVFILDWLNQQCDDVLQIFTKLLLIKFQRRKKVFFIFRFATYFLFQIPLMPTLLQDSMTSSIPQILQTETRQSLQACRLISVMM